MGIFKIAALAFGLPLVATAASAATLSLAGTGYATVALTGTFDLDGGAAYNALDAASVARDGTSVSVLTGAAKNASNGLRVSGPARVTYTYLGSEAGFTNIALLLPTTELFRNHGSSSVGDTKTTTVSAAGLLNFLFRTVSGSPGEIANNGSASPNTASIAIAYSALFNGGKSAIVLFDDTGAGPDRDYDDLGLRIDVAAVPVPAAGLMLAGALAGLGALRRRRSA